MDVYRQASEIVRMVRERVGTAKALCLRKEMQKKKQTYAVVCETLRHYELLEDVLQQSEFFQYYPRANRDLAMVLAFDEVIGKGINTKADTTARAISQSGSYLREAYFRVKKHHVIAPREVQQLHIEDEIEEARGARNSGTPENIAESGTCGILPRYGRVNTLKISRDELVEVLRRSNKRPRDEEGSPEGFGSTSSAKAQAGGRKAKQFPPIVFSYDKHVPDLLVFPPSTDLHNHPAVRRGQLVLQDKSSCLPACVLLGAVPVTESSSSSIDGDDAPPIEYVIDACAAPGNKTTQIAALGAPHNVKILAIERDAGRAETLANRVRSLGASEAINVVNQDFFTMSSGDREAAEAILLDPSCSSSGVVSRVDVSLARHIAERAANNDEGSVNEEAGKAKSRVEQLARVQKKLLMHALLSFSNCRRVVYSTCSVNTEENEDVVRLVLADERVQKQGWALSNIMPGSWTTRGVGLPSDLHPLHFTIRCDPKVDKTNGFFVARFDRLLRTTHKAAHGQNEPPAADLDEEQDEQ
jgi:putative methyltransferase